MLLFQIYNLELSIISLSAPQHWLGCQVPQCMSVESSHVRPLQEKPCAAPASEVTGDSMSTPPTVSMLPSSSNSSVTVAFIGGVVAVVLIVAIAAATIVVALVLRNR